MIYPSDVEVNRSGSVWVLSNRLPKFLYGNPRLEEVNFKILTSTIRTIIKGTVCDAM